MKSKNHVYIRSQDNTQMKFDKLQGVDVSLHKITIILAEGKNYCIRKESWALHCKCFLPLEVLTNAANSVLYMYMYCILNESIDQ